jgi:transposase
VESSSRDIERSDENVTMTDAERAATEVILGVDTHLDVHMVVALDRLGRRLGELSVPTTAKGYERLVRWAEGFGTVRCAGVEGTSSYGAAITRYLRKAAIPVREVERPKRRHLHRTSKSDSRDAESAARAGNKPERRPGSPRARTDAWR